MQEKLNRISEDFRAAYNLKKEIESKSYLTDSDKEELEIIDNWLDEFRNQINDWAEEYNKNNNLSNEYVAPKEKTLREQFEENRIKLDELKYESKSMYPKFKSSDKKRKAEILNSLGFIETKTVDDRKIMMHSSLVGKYYDLVKEQKVIIEKLKEEYRKNSKVVVNDNVIEIIAEDENIISDNREQQIEEMKSKFDKNQQEIAKILAGKGLGKKDYIKYHGAKYWVPKVYKNRFIALMNEQERLSKELNLVEEYPKKNKNNEENLVSNNDSIIENNNIEIVEKKEDDLTLTEEVEGINAKEVITSDESLIEFENVDELKNDTEEVDKTNNEIVSILSEKVKQIKKGSENLKNKILQGKGKLKTKLLGKIKNGYEKYKNHLNKINEYKEKKSALLEEKKNIDYKKSNLESLVNEINTRLEYKNIFLDDSKEENYLQDMQKLNEQIQNELDIIDKQKEAISSEIKSIRRPKINISEKAKKNIKKTITKIALVAGLSATALAAKSQVNKNSQQNNPEPVVIDEEKNDQINDDVIFEDIPENPSYEMNDENGYFVGDEIYNASGDIYDNMVSATDKTDSKSSYFGENTEVYIVGWGIKLNDDMIFISKNDSDYEEKIQNYIDQGGEVTSYAVTNVNSGEIEQITGFYNNEQISQKSR